MLRIDLTDAPAPELDALLVTIDEVDIRLEGGWVEVSTGSVQLDLLQLQDVFTPLVTAATLPSGTVTGLRLIVTEASAVVAGETVEVKVPSQLGHNHGLRHGGAANCPAFKPNYNSVMNPWYETGIDTDRDAQINEGELDFSHGDCFNIDERFVNEYQGVCSGGPPIDWTSDGLQSNVAENINPPFNRAPTSAFGPASCPDDVNFPTLTREEVLGDHDDWEDLIFFPGGTVPSILFVEQF